MMHGTLVITVWASMRDITVLAAWESQHRARCDQFPRAAGRQGERAYSVVAVIDPARPRAYAAALSHRVMLL